MPLVRFIFVLLHSLLIERVAGSQLNRIVVGEATEPVGLEDQWWLAAKKSLSPKVLDAKATLSGNVRTDAVLESRSDARHVPILAAPDDKIRLIREFEEHKRAEDLEQRWWLKDSKTQKATAADPTSSELNPRREEGRAPMVFSPQDEVKLIKDAGFSSADKINQAKEFEKGPQKHTRSNSKESGAPEASQDPTKEVTEFLERKRAEDDSDNWWSRGKRGTTDAAKAADAGLKLKGGVFVDDGYDVVGNTDAAFGQKLSGGVLVDDGSNIGAVQSVNVSDVGLKLVGGVSVNDGADINGHGNVGAVELKFRGGIFVDDVWNVSNTLVGKAVDAGLKFRAGVVVDGSDDRENAGVEADGRKLKGSVLVDDVSNESTSQVGGIGQKVEGGVSVGEGSSAAERTARTEKQTDSGKKGNEAAQMKQHSSAQRARKRHHSAAKLRALALKNMEAKRKEAKEVKEVVSSEEQGLLARSADLKGEGKAGPRKESIFLAKLANGGEARAVVPPEEQVLQAKPKKVKEEMETLSSKGQVMQTFIVADAVQRFQGGILVDDDFDSTKISLVAATGRKFEGGMSMNDVSDAKQSTKEVAVGGGNIEGGAFADQSSASTGKTTEASEVARAYKFKGGISMDDSSEVDEKVQTVKVARAVDKFKGGVAVDFGSVVEENNQAVKVSDAGRKFKGGVFVDDKVDVEKNANAAASIDDGLDATQSTAPASAVEGNLKGGGSVEDSSDAAEKKALASKTGKVGPKFKEEIPVDDGFVVMESVQTVEVNFK